MGTHSPHSDADIALVGPDVTLREESQIAAALHDLSPEFTVDLIRMNVVTNQALLRHIEKHGVVVFEP